MSSPLNIFIGELEQLRKTSALPLAVIVGPTASGKTGASIALAKAIGERGVAVEIINADSRQCYKELDIGTAKITEEEMQGIPHHLFDALDPRTPITVAWYQKRAKEIIYEIQKRGALPVLVGGSMLYISAVIDGLALAPPGDPTLRKKLESDYDLDGGLTLYKKLQQIDPEAAAAFHANNKQYVVRAMEIFMTTGAKPSLSKKKSKSDYDLFMIGIEWPREQLTKRIDARTKQMLDSGWIEEVQALLKAGYTREDPGMQSHGYREIESAISNGKWTPLRPPQADFEGQEMENGKFDTTILAENISAKVRQYAKRQMTWWKGDPRIRWVSEEVCD